MSLSARIVHCLNHIMVFVSGLLVMMGLVALSLNAIEREMAWRQERLCQHYGDAVNAQAMKQGEATRC